MLRIDFFWRVLSLWSPCKVSWRFGGTCNLHLQSRRVNQARYLHETVCRSCSSILKIGATYSSETLVDTQRITRRNVKIEFFITTALRTSNPADSFILLSWFWRNNYEITCLSVPPNSYVCRVVSRGRDRRLFLRRTSCVYYEITLLAVYPPPPNLFVLCSVRIVSKESRRLILRRTYLLSYSLFEGVLVARQ
jgi:hypothetical protein